MADLGAGTGRPHDRQPVLLRTSVGGLRREDLHRVTGLKLVVKGHEPATDPGSHRPVADVRVDRVGEVDRRRPRREIHDVPLRREHEHLSLVEVDLQARHELAGIRHLLLPFEHPPEPGDFGLLVGRAR